MAPIIAVPLVLVSVFALGRCSAPDPTHTVSYRDVPRTVTKTMVVTKPAPLPDACQDVIDQIDNLVAANDRVMQGLQNLDTATKRIGTAYGQDMAAFNAARQQFDNEVVLVTGRGAAEVGAVQYKINRRIRLCTDALKE